MGSRQIQASANFDLLSTRSMRDGSQEASTPLHGAEADPLRAQDCHIFSSFLQQARCPQASQRRIATHNHQQTMMTQPILAPVSLGELIDKITILQIKTKHLTGAALANVKKELDALETTLGNLQITVDPSLIKQLKGVNQGLWQIEDAIRDQERQKTFGETFIHLARSVYQQNDRRAAIKKEINLTYGSNLVEEKSYQQY